MSALPTRPRLDGATVVGFGPCEADGAPAAVSIATIAAVASALTTVGRSLDDVAGNAEQLALGNFPPE
jgi:hypothetical protein